MKTTNYMATFKVYHVANFITELDGDASDVLFFNSDVVCRVEVPLHLIAPGALYWQVAKQRSLRISNHDILDKVGVHKNAGDWSDQLRLVGFNGFRGVKHYIFYRIPFVSHGRSKIFIVKFVV